MLFLTIRELDVENLGVENLGVKNLGVDKRSLKGDTLGLAGDNKYQMLKRMD